MKKVAAYCRVSTDKEDQANSLESQQLYFKQYIDRSDDWELIELYVDNGITGTNTNRRQAFNKMIDDARQHRFDLILTKEISRFSRNTLDSIQYTRQLKTLGIGVVFMNDGINTLDPDAELRLTIMSSIAQEESRKTSERVKWGQRRRMEQGVVFGTSMLGYDVQKGSMYINEEGAEIVKLIFHKFLREGKGTHVIAEELREAGYKTYNQKINWSNTMILKILRNEKYAGDLIQKKTYTPDFLSHKKKYNNGQEELIILRNHHTPIIDIEVFTEAQMELKRRRPTEVQRAKYTNRYCFSGKLKCDDCGGNFVSRTKKRKDGSIYKAWRCHEAAKHGRPRKDAAGNKIGCNGRQISDHDLMLIMSQFIKNLLFDRNFVVRKLVGIIESSLILDSTDEGIKKIEKKIADCRGKKENLIELFLNKDISKEEYDGVSLKYRVLIEKLENEKGQLEKHEQDGQDKEQQLKGISAVIEAIVNGDQMDGTFYRDLLEKIVIYDRKRMDFHLKPAPFVWEYTVGETNTGRYFLSRP